MKAGSNQRPQKSELDIVVEALQVYSEMGFLNGEDREQAKLMLAKLSVVYAYRNLLTEEERLDAQVGDTKRTSVSLVLEVNEKQ